MNENEQNLGKLLKVFNADRVISPDEIQEVLNGIVGILAQNKKGVEALNSETKQELKTTIQTLLQEHNSLLSQINRDLSKSKAEIEKATKAQNDRAFKRLQELISNIRMPEDGKNASPEEVVPLVLEQIKLPENEIESPESIRDKLELLDGEERLDVSAIKGLEKYFGKVYKKGKDMLVGGVRFFEQLADVSILITKKRQDLLAQYNTTNNRWQDGVAITVSTTAPSNPVENDVWIDTN